MDSFNKAYDPLHKAAIITINSYGEVNMKTARCVQKIQQFMWENHGVEIEWITPQDTASIQRLRCGGAAKALDNGAQVTLWLDADQEISAHDAAALFFSPHPIIGAAIQKRPTHFGAQPQLTYLPMKEEEGKGGIVVHRHDDLRTVVEVGSLGTGCLAVRSEVYHDLKDHTYRLIEPGVEMSEWYRNYFWLDLIPVGEEDGETIYLPEMEDRYFLRMAKELCGYDVMLDPFVRAIHYEGRYPLPVTFADMYYTHLFNEEDKEKAENDPTPFYTVD